MPEKYPLLRTLGAFYEDYPLIATFPHQTGQSRTNRPDTALGGLWESSGHAGGNTLSGSPSPVGAPAGCWGPDGLTGPASPRCGPIEAEGFSPWGAADGNPGGDGRAPVRQMAVDEVGVPVESCPLDERAGFTSLKRAVPGTPPDSSAHQVPTRR